MKKLAAWWVSLPYVWRSRIEGAILFLLLVAAFWFLVTLKSVYK